MVSQKKIAESLGMPVSTVANILNGMPRYSEKSREKVLKEAERLGYRPNRASRALGRGRSNLIGVIHFGSIYEPGQQAAQCLPHLINELGYDYLVIDLHWHEGSVERVLNEVIQARVEGVIVVANTTAVFGREALDILQRMGIPVVSCLGDDDLAVPFTSSDAASAYFAMMRHLQDIGHRSFIMPSLPSGDRPTVERITGFSAAMKGVGDLHQMDEATFTARWPRLYREHRDQPVGIIVTLDVDGYQDDIFHAYREWSTRLFASRALPDAIVAINDRGACGLFDAAYQQNIRIPDDVAVTGCDNEQVGEFSMFRLTSIRVNVVDPCRAGLQMLQRLIRKEELEQREVTFQADLVLRQSCGRLIGLGESPTCYQAVEPLSLPSTS